MLRTFALATLAAALLSTPAFAGHAFLMGQYVSGLNRICLYNHLGSTIAITIPASQVCAAQIRV